MPVEPLANPVSTHLLCGHGIEPSSRPKGEEVHGVESKGWLGGCRRLHRDYEMDEANDHEASRGATNPADTICSAGKDDAQVSHVGFPSAAHSGDVPYRQRIHCLLHGDDIELSSQLRGRRAKIESKGQLREGLRRPCECETEEVNDREVR